MRKVIVGLCLLLPMCAQAKTEISGDWIQGGLLKGKTLPGAAVRIFERDVYVSGKGDFVFGLGRDTKEQVSLQITYPSGEIEKSTYTVEQREYKTEKIEGVAKKYVAPPAEVTQRIRKDSAMVGTARKVFSKHDHFSDGFIWPLVGRITGVYGSQRVFNGVPKRPHYGLDIAGPVGAKVIAPANGTVTLVHDDMYYSGGTLIVDHGQGVSSTFIHLNKILVELGQSVTRGQAIAEVGATGRVTGPHLDWRINWFNQRLDPALLLPPMPEY